MKIAYTVSLRLTNEGERFFGPGPLRLMQLVQKHHSLHRAAAEMNMAYSKAWRMMQNVESAMGTPMLIRSRGGTRGGGSELTEAAEKLLGAYLSFQQAVEAEAARQFHAHFDGMDG